MQMGGSTLKEEYIYAYPQTQTQTQGFILSVSVYHIPGLDSQGYFLKSIPLALGTV
jgi:hypothetical protein